MSTATPVQRLLIVVGAVVLLGGLACVVLGFASFAGGDVDQDGGSLALFASGGFAAVIGFGIIAFTRAAILTGDGAYSRVTIERGARPSRGRFCSGCGRPVAPTARFCETCGHAVG